MGLIRELLWVGILVISNVYSAKEEPKVCIKDGCLIGLTETSRIGREYFSFLGIPFAKPPIEKLRFKPPERPEPWDTLDAKQDGNICPQSVIFRQPEDPQGSEDCLYLNVYTPQIPRDSMPGGQLPVIVIFHSGGFQLWAGTRDYFPANYILDRDVVVVSGNYRLNVFGFLSTEDEVSPGNYGLKDQRLVLQWVQENVAAFGGDPDSVTIQGQDAGAASVHFHILSPPSKGLFHRAIAQSGNALAPWAMSLPGESREHAEYLGKSMDCPIENSTVLVECLRWKSTEDLLGADPIFFVWHIDPIIPWKPAVEPEHEGAFLTQRPAEALKVGNFLDVPMLTGVTSHEGLYRAAGMLSWEPILLNWNALPIKSYTSALNLYHLEFEELKETIIKIRDFYFGDEKVRPEQSEQFINLFSDRYFFHPMARTVELQLLRQESPIYVYKFGFEAPSGFSFAKMFAYNPENFTYYRGSCHGDDLIFQYPLEKTFFKGLVRDDEGMAMIDRILDLWINFVTHGNPTPEGYNVTWDPVISNLAVEYLSIDGPNDLEMKPGLYTKDLEFWDDLNLEREISKDADFLHHDEL